MSQSDNAKVCYESVHLEIWKQSQGNPQTFTCAAGTGGKLIGVGRFLGEKNCGRKRVLLAGLVRGSVAFVLVCLVSWTSVLFKMNSLGSRIACTRGRSSKDIGVSCFRSKWVEARNPTGAHLGAVRETYC